MKQETEPMADDDRAMSETMEIVPDVANMALDLTKEEKLRATSLMLGIRYYTDTIIKDAAYLQLMMQKEKESKFSNDPDQVLWHLRPASVNGVIRCAQEFEQYLLGNRPGIQLMVGDQAIDPVDQPNPADSERVQGER